MKSTADVVVRIDQTIEHMLARPTMYASSPEGLEDVLYQLDGLRSWIIADEEPVEPGYSRFLGDRGFQAMNFTFRARGRREATRLTDEDLRIFKDLAAFFCEYLDHRDRERPSDRIDALQHAGWSAVMAHDALLAYWRNLTPDALESLTQVADVGLLMTLIERRIYPIPAFGALVRIDLATAREMLLSRYLGRAVDPDRKFGGYTYELASMLDDLFQAGGQYPLADLVRHADVSQERLADLRVIEAFADALDIEPAKAQEWIRRVQQQGTGTVDLSTL